ncbi:unnamed protein product [Parajaminaea phylloscopi]
MARVVHLSLGLTVWLAVICVSVTASTGPLILTPQLLSAAPLTTPPPVPYATPDLTSFAPSSRGVHTAGDDAAKACTWLGPNFNSSKYSLDSVFAQYYPEGSNPSLELLAQTYPPDTLPVKPSLKSLLSGVGPDFDLSVDGYGKNTGRAASNGPLGGLPAFCRYGAYIRTSELTRVLTEIWMPLGSDESLPLAAVNGTDYPTASTPIELAQDGSYVKGPPYLLKANEPPPPPPAAASPPASTLEPEPMTARSHEAKAGAKGHHQDRAYLTGDEVLGKGDGWNGRLLWMGNGGLRGAPPTTDLKQVMARYRFAVAGSNTGHWSTTGGATWVNGSQYAETLKDWGGRSTHVGKHLAEEVVKAFYGRAARKSYYTGCSNGGKAGFESAMHYPGDFDGIMAGSPGINFNRMNAGQIHTQARHRKASVGAGWFPLQLLQGPVHQTILDQCDRLDGVEDGILVNPRNCKPDFTGPLLCGGGGKYGGDNTTCLTEEQIDNLEELYKPTVIDGHFIYPAYAIGAESKADAVSGSAAKSGNWYDLAVRKSPSLSNDGNWSYWKDLTWDVVRRGDREGGVWSASKIDLSEAFKTTKIMSYHGLSDFTISPYSTESFLGSVKRATKGKLPAGKQFGDVLRFFEVPGMNHCRDGPSAWHFGGVTQNDAGNRPYKFSTRYDLLLSLVAWVEQGYVSPYQVAAEYESRSKVVSADDGDQQGGDGDSAKDPRDELPTVFQSYNFGVKNTRKLCPWPQRAVYDGEGPTMGARSFESFRCR